MFDESRRAGEGEIAGGTGLRADPQIVSHAPSPVESQLSLLTTVLTFLNSEAQACEEMKTKIITQLSIEEDTLDKLVSSTSSMKSNGLLESTVRNSGPRLTMSQLLECLDNGTMEDLSPTRSIAPLLSALVGTTRELAMENIRLSHDLEKASSELLATQSANRTMKTPKPGAESVENASLCRGIDTANLEAALALADKAAEEWKAASQNMSVQLIAIREGSKNLRRCNDSVQSPGDASSASSGVDMTIQKERVGANPDGPENGAPRGSEGVEP